MALDHKLAQNLSVTPYVWEASRAGILIAVEYPPTGPETTFSQIGFSVRLRGELHREIPTFVNDTGTTIAFKARSLREAILPMVELDIEPGDAVIWAHRRVHAIGVNDPNATGNTMVYETMLFGKETVAGAVQILQIWPSGELHRFQSYAAALTTL